MLEVIDNGIMAIIPKYIDNKGNCTVIFTKKKEPIVVEKTVISVVNRLFKHYMVDLEETKKRYVGLIASPNATPLPLGKDDVLIPLKTRKPICKNDGAVGYFNIKYLKKYSDNGQRTILYLENDLEIECLYREMTVDKRIRHANVVKRCYEERSMNVAENEITYDGRNPIVVVCKS